MKNEKRIDATLLSLFPISKYSSFNVEYERKQTSLHGIVVWKTSICKVSSSEVLLDSNVSRSSKSRAIHKSVMRI